MKYPAAAPDVVQKLIENAMEKADEAAVAIAGHKELPVKRNFNLLSKIANHSYLYKGIAEWDEKFIATEKCTGCGLCAKVCPVCNIKTSNRHPSWQHHCERCLACIQWCPSEAIEYGKKTIGRRRYHNPNVCRRKYNKVNPAVIYERNINFEWIKSTHVISEYMCGILP